ncbi:MAG: LptF/LptG family permease [Bdellovibrionota bacterium]
MALFQKIDRLLAGEIISLTFVITAGVSSIMMMAKLPKYADFLFSAPDILTSFLMLLLYILPSILKLTVPISLLLACAIVTMRMSADRELEAWMSCGVSIVRLAFMPTLLGVGVMFISLSSSLYFEPYSNKQWEKFKWLQGRSLVEAFIKNSLKEKSFIYDLRDSKNLLMTDAAKLSLYFGNVNSSKTHMKDVFIAFSDPNSLYSSYIIAKTGELSKELVSGYPDYLFKLNTGFIYSYKEGKNSLPSLMKQQPASHYVFPNKNIPKSELNLYPTPSDWTVTQYSNLNLSLVSVFKDKFKIEMNPTNQMDQLYPKEYFTALTAEKEKKENWKTSEDVVEKILFFMKQISVPVSTVFLPLIGVCLGILDPRKKQISVYFGIGIVIFALYSSLSLCQQLALKFVVSPYSMLFVTPFVLILILLVLMRWRSRYPPSCGFFEFISNDYSKLKYLFIHKRPL